MPSRYWVAGITALILATPLQAQPASDSEGEKKSAAQAAKPAANDPPIVSMLDRIVYELSETRVEQRDPYGDERNQRERRDVVAQEEMAKWAWPMFLAMLAQTAVAGAALVFLMKDLRQNRKSAELQLRAYIVPSGVNYDGYYNNGTNELLYVSCPPLWRNDGQTPAMMCQASAIHIFGNDDTPVFDWAEPALATTFTLGRSDKPNKALSVEHPIAEMNAAFERGEYIFCYSAISYFDIFDRWHTEECCIKVKQLSPLPATERVENLAAYFHAVTHSHYRVRKRGQD